MRRFFQLRMFYFLVLGIFLFQACNPDDETVAIPPSSSLSDSAITIGAADTIMVTLTGTKGDNDMNLVEFRKDGDLLDAGLITIDGTPAASNRVLLFDTERESFSWEVAIVAHDMGTSTYSFIIEDDTGSNTSTESVDVTIEDADPTISVSASGMYTTPAGSGVEFDLTADGNGADLASVGFYQDGTLLDITQIKFGEVEATENPITLTGDDVSSFTKAVIIRPGMTTGLMNYTAEVTNASGTTASAAFSIDVTPTGTALDDEYFGVLLENAAGPNLTGGIDLHLGETVSVNSALADIIDLGNDGVPSWRQQIGGKNATLKKISAAQIDGGLSFGTITFKEELVEAFDEADALANNESGVVAIGDVFFVFTTNGPNGTNDYFAIECETIGTNSGLGFYNFAIKQALDQ